MFNGVFTCFNRVNTTTNQGWDREDGERTSCQLGCTSMESMTIITSSVWMSSLMWHHDDHWSVDMVTGCFSNGWLQVLIIFLPRGMKWQTSFCLIGTISPTSLHVSWDESQWCDSMRLQDRSVVVFAREWLFIPRGCLAKHSPRKVFGRRS